MTSTTPRTMSATLTSLVEKFHSLQAAHAAAADSFKAASEAATKANHALKEAAKELETAKAEMQAAFLDDVDPMPLVPAPRPGSGKCTFTVDMAEIMGRTLSCGIIQANSLRA